MEPVPRTSQPRSPTIRDVARRAGVGVGTVSRVLNDSPQASPEARARVRRAVEELGFRRSAAARTLSLGRSQAVGVLAPFFTSPSVVDRLRGVAERLAQRGYDLVLFDVETLQQRADAMHDFARRDRVAGLLVISLPLSDDELERTRREELPVVLVDVVHPGVPHVGIDNVAGGELAGRHLLAKGHRRIAFVGDAPTNPFGFTSSEDRRRGFRNALERAGIEPPAGHERTAAHGREQARALAESLLAHADPPTAVFAASDLQAIGVLEAAAAAGVRVPEDLAVIGFDDIEMASAVGLTTVRQPLRQSGARGTDLLLAAIEGSDDAPGEQLDPLAVIERRTT